MCARSAWLEPTDASGSAWFHLPSVHPCLAAPRRASPGHAAASSAACLLALLVRASLLDLLGLAA